MQVGDPSPDNVGGQLTIEGWAGTQGDTLTLDFATTNTTGVVTENSKKMLGIVNTAATTFTTVASVDIALTQNPSGVLCHEVDVFALKASSSSTQLSVQFSYDGGGTFKSGASDYSYYYEYKNLGSPSDVSYVADAAHTQIVLATNVSIDAFRSWLKLHVLTVASGTEPTMLIADLKGYDSGGNPAAASAHGYGLGSYGKATHMRLLASTGTITGAYRVAGNRGFGE